MDSDGDGDPDVSDCDDADATIYTGAPEVWYDGVDQDCLGGDDYDQDGDGDPAEAYGGLDCDDLDPAVSICRPAPGCTSPTTVDLDLYDPAGVSDLAFNDACEAVVVTIISGTDHVRVIDANGTVSFGTGFSNYDISSVAIDPLTGDFALGYSSTLAVGYGTGTGIPVIANSGTGSLRRNAGPWANGYLDAAPASIAMDTAGCIWTPNWAVEGDLACVEVSGAVTIVGSYGIYIESLALGPDETLYVAIDDTVSTVDTTTGALTTVFVAAGTVLDFVVDFNDDLYVESTADVIELVPGDGSSSSTWLAVSGDAKLVISPDGWLIRLRPDPVSPATYNGYDLDP